MESVHNYSITGCASACVCLPIITFRHGNHGSMALSHKLIASSHSSVITRDIHELHVCIKFIFSCNRINSTTLFLHSLSSRRDDDVFASRKKVFPPGMICDDRLRCCIRIVLFCKSIEWRARGYSANWLLTFNLISWNVNDRRLTVLETDSKSRRSVRGMKATTRECLLISNHRGFSIEGLLKPKDAMTFRRGMKIIFYRHGLTNKSSLQRRRANRVMKASCIRINKIIGLIWL